MVLDAFLALGRRGSGTATTATTIATTTISTKPSRAGSKKDHEFRPMSQSVGLQPCRTQGAHSVSEFAKTCDFDGVEA